jgi:hypothetical protein
MKTEYDLVYVYGKPCLLQYPSVCRWELWLHNPSHSIGATAAICPARSQCQIIFRNNGSCRALWRACLFPFQVAVPLSIGAYGSIRAHTVAECVRTHERQLHLFSCCSQCKVIAMSEEYRRRHQECIKCKAPSSLTLRLFIAFPVRRTLIPLLSAMVQFVTIFLVEPNVCIVVQLWSWSL